LPALPDLFGQSCPTSAREVHLQGLQEAIKERLTRGSAAVAKLRYHARWLLYLGEPEQQGPPKISIIIPIYNRAWLVDSLIQNCLDQRYSTIEIVVVDDGSTDNTSARLAAFRGRIKLIRQPNCGVSAARNAGVLAAAGEFVHFLDSDDLLDTRHMEAKVRAFAAVPDAELCYCEAQAVPLFGVQPLCSGQAFRRLNDDHSRTTNLLESMLVDGYPFFVGSVTMPRHVVLRHGPFETDLRRAEDERYWFRLALAGVKVIGLPQRLFYRCAMTDGLHEKRLLDSTPSILVVMRNVIDLLRIPEHWPAVAEYLSRNYQAQRWQQLLGSQASAFTRDFGILLEVIADLPRVGRSSNRSPLPVLIFLWMLGEFGRSLDRTLGLHELLSEALLAAMARAKDVGQVDKEDWANSGQRLRENRSFAKIVSVGTIPNLPRKLEAKVNEVRAFLQSVANVVCDRSAVPLSMKPRPRATIVVPVAADPSAAEATISSCFAQTAAHRIEVIAIENDGARAAFWIQRFPHIRVIVSSTAREYVDAHAAGLRVAKAARVRFLFPGDILHPSSLERQIRISKSLDEEIPIAEVKRPNDPKVSVRPIKAREIRSQRMFSAMLFPRSVLARLGGFDSILGGEYQARYLFRLRAAGIPVAFIRAGNCTTYAKSLPSSGDETHITALANIIQCLSNRALWPQIPAIQWSAVRKDDLRNSELISVKVRLVDFMIKTITDLSANAASCSPLVAFTLCLVGLESGRSRAKELTSAILKGASGIQLDTFDELSLANSLVEADDKSSFAKAVKKVLREIRGRPEYAGLQSALQHLDRLQDDESAASHPSKVNLIERLKRRLRGPSSLIDDRELRGRSFWLPRWIVHRRDWRQLWRAVSAASPASNRITP
jgi:glycosyltransferase involved in cell wall biosynthesis